jgi:hypothetical protein
MKAQLSLFFFFLLSINLYAQRPQSTNYDESKVPDYTLPNILKTADNQVVRTIRDWQKIRRPEVLDLFSDNIYGQMPVAYDSIRYSVSNEDRQSMNGKAYLKEVLIKIFKQNRSVEIKLTLFIPNDVPKPVPAFLLINNRGKENTDATRTVKSEFWPAEIVIDSGYAIAAFHVSDLAPDNKDEFTKGVLELYPEQLEADNGMRAIGAWAWGAGRVMDYFENESLINDKKIVVTGHSRGGKASLWAAANDQRFAICISNCSGNTGAALARRQFGERVEVINTVFPHWFSPNYKKYNGHEELLPVDQHMLIGLIAPRPVYATNASEDLWADPKGTFLSLKNAEDVYALYGLRSKLPTSPPALNQPVIQSPIAYHNREGKHDMTVYDWTQFIRFANYHFKGIGK